MSSMREKKEYGSVVFGLRDGFVCQIGEEIALIATKVSTKHGPRFQLRITAPKDIKITRLRTEETTTQERQHE